MKRWSSWLCAALLFVGMGGAVAASYNDEVSNLVRAGKTVKALGPELFGDRVNEYTGALEFVQNDVALPGNDALPVAVSRRLAPGWGPRNRLGLFGDWDLEIPRLQGTFSNRNGWSTGGTNGNRRCTNFDGPGTVLGTNNASSWDQEEYWRGNLLYVPGQGEVEVLRRTASTPAMPSDGNTYPLVTKSHWALRCGTLQSNAFFTASVNNQGEGFIARSPDGLVYRFDWLVRRDADLMTRAGALSTLAVPESTQSRVGSDIESEMPEETQAAASALLSRTEVWILPTEVRDRFGNWVRYAYDPASPRRLLSITSSDGRVLTLGYVGSSGRVDSVTDGTRTWRYVYGSTGELIAVTQPDATQLTIGGGDSVAIAGAVSVDLGCTGTGNPDLSGSALQTITFGHPSGAQGVFTLRLTSHARSFVPQVCFGERFANARYPRYFATKSLVGKRISGVGMPTQSWSYGYSAVNGQGTWSTCTGACPDTKTVTITGPDGANRVLTYGTRHNTTDGKLLRVDEFSTTGTLLRSTVQTWRMGREMGLSVLDMGDGASTSMRQDPLLSKLITQQGQTFAWYGDAVDSFDRVTQQRRAGPGGTRTETIAFHDHFGIWVLGQTRRVTTAAGQVMLDRDFDPATATIAAVREFGVTKETIAYNADGTVSGRRDGAGRLTSFANYRRGVAQRVTYPDLSTESVTVNDLGWVTSHTNAANFTTQYGYDNTWGLITSITPPAGFTPTSLRFERATVAAFGLPAGHWRHTVTKGSAVTQTLLDAYWRPVMTRTFDASNEAATRKVTVTGYDLNGRPSFESYPQRDIASTSVASPGKRTTYDALGRVTLIQTDSELGVLTTSTAYLGSFQTQTTNPRGRVTTQGFWALDDPAKAQLATITAPAGVNVSIARDSFGKPTAVTRSGTFAGYTSNVTRRYVYDAGQRLCKTIEPEVGSTVQAYDAAGNLAWKAPGQNLPDAAACNDASVPLAARITYAYDTLNRLTGVSYGDGSPAVTRTYTPDGLLQSITSNGGTWTYGYNALRKLATETFTLGTQTFNFSWGYNAAGDLSALTYPDRTVTYSPNALGEAQSVGGFANGVTYHPNGAVATYTTANGIAHSVTQNARGLPLVNRATGVLQDLYAYDANGNVTGIADQQEGIFNRTLGYDDLDRLISASAPGVWGNATYAYDPVDNLRAATVGSRSTVLNVGANNQLTSITTNGSTANYSFDARGNLTAKGQQTFGFDLGNRLNFSSLGGSYAYDGHGRRFRVVSTDGSTRLQLYSQAGQILWATSTGGPRPASTTAYIYLGNKAIAEVNSASGTQYLHTDALGSPVARTNAAGTVINRTRYEPYGFVAAGAKPSAGIGALGFTGHVQDAETDLVYMQQRYYDPLAGRFLSVDPVVTDAESGAQFGRYVYASNTPYNKIDPDGRLGIDNDQCRRMAGKCEVLVDNGGSEGWRMRAKSDGEYVSSFLEHKFDSVVSDEAMMFFPPLILGRMALGTFRSLGDYVAQPSVGGTVGLAMGMIGRVGPLNGLTSLTAAEVRATVKELGVPFGRSGQAFNVGSETALTSLFQRLTVGARGVSANYDGVMKILGDGTRIGLRNESKFGGKVIDVFPSNGKPYKVHIGGGG